VRLTVSDSVAERVILDADTGTYVYLVYNEPLERMLLSRRLTGLDFRTACLESSRLFLRHIANDIADEAPTELLILSKGLAYQMSEAFALEVQKNLPTNVIATTRSAVEGDTVKIDIPYARLDAGGETLIIGDTVASGATVVAALTEYRIHHRLKSAYVFSYAGAITGARHISDYCQANDISLTLMFGLAAFGLGSNGFDLSFLHPDTRTRGEYVRRAQAMFDGRQISAVGWDFGSQSMAPGKYADLCWVEARVNDLPDGMLPLPVRPPDLSSLWREKDAFSAHTDLLVSDPDGGQEE
jgi:hypothetical protein